MNIDCDGTWQLAKVSCSAFGGSRAPDEIQQRERPDKHACWVYPVF